MARENEKALKSFNFRALRFLVRLAGIEPTTPWFVAKYSIQLSYSREALNSSTKKSCLFKNRRLVGFDTNLSVSLATMA